MTDRRRGPRRQADRRAEPEHEEQKSLFYWASLHEARIPELRWLYAIPNGRFRHISEAVKLKAEGVRAGVPDVALDVARGGYHGLRIEMKAPGRASTTSDIQLAWHQFLRAQGYDVRVFDDWRAAWNHLMVYLGHPALKQQAT